MMTATSQIALRVCVIFPMHPLVPPVRHRRVAIMGHVLCRQGIEFRAFLLKPCGERVRGRFLVGLIETDHLHDFRQRNRGPAPVALAADRHNTEVANMVLIRLAMSQSDFMRPYVFTATDFDRWESLSQLALAPKPQNYGDGTSERRQ
jgi:hypothetical protein